MAALTTETRRWVYTGDAVTTGFSYDNYIVANTDLAVYLELIASPYTQTLQTLTTHYSVTGVGAIGGGNVVMVTAPAATHRVVIVSKMPNTQPSDFDPRKVLSNTAHTLALHRLAAEVQQLKAGLDRAVRLGDGDSQTLAALASLKSFESKYLYVDANRVIQPTAATQVAVSAAMEPVVLAATIPIARVALGFAAALDAFWTAATLPIARVALGFAAALDAFWTAATIPIARVALGFAAALDAFWTAATMTAARQALGAIGNERLAKAAAYPVVNADKSKTIACSALPWTLTFAAATGYDADFAVFVLNESAARGLKVAISGGTDFWLYPGQTALVYRQDTAWRVLRPERWKIAAALTVFVDVTNGNAANDGLAAGAGNALATFAQARDLVCQALDFNNLTVTIQIADGTYPQMLVDLQHNWVGGGRLDITGNTATPANVLFSVAGDHAAAFHGFKSGRIRLRGMKFTTSAAGYGLWATRGVYVEFNGNLEFAATAYAQIAVMFDATLEVLAGYTINGGASIHWEADQRGAIIASQVGAFTITLTGTPAFSNQFARCIAAIMDLGGSITFSGAATGQRYSVSENGVVRVAGAGAAYLPGNAAGAVATGGQYN